MQHQGQPAYTRHRDALVAYDVVRVTVIGAADEWYASTTAGSKHARCGAFALLPSLFICHLDTHVNQIHHKKSFSSSTFPHASQPHTPSFPSPQPRTRLKQITKQHDNDNDSNHAIPRHSNLPKRRQSKLRKLPRLASPNERTTPSVPHTVQYVPVQSL